MAEKKTKGKKKEDKKPVVEKTQVSKRAEKTPTGRAKVQVTKREPEKAAKGAKKAKEPAEVAGKEETRVKKEEEKGAKREEPTRKESGGKGAKTTAKKPKKSYRIIRSKEASARARERSRLKKRKGKFKRQNYGKKKKVPDRWRRPDGIDSGHQKDEKSKPAHPRPGYMTPKGVKGIDPSGYECLRVFNVAGLQGVDSKRQAILIASAVGKKKRSEIQKAAQNKSIQVLNYKE